jgi:hypothetical protein
MIISSHQEGENKQKRKTKKKGSKPIGSEDKTTFVDSMTGSSETLSFLEKSWTSVSVTGCRGWPDEFFEKKSIVRGVVEEAVLWSGRCTGSRVLMESG